jgi:undecaprenyl-diphosphatase
MTAFSIALVVSYFYPSLEGALFFMALSIAVSRIVLGMHYLSDVLAGVALGVALGCASITARRRGARGSSWCGNRLRTC